MTNYLARVPRLARAVALPFIGTVLLGVGVGFRIWGALHRSFGWYAYVPLSLDPPVFFGGAGSLSVI